MKRLWAIQTFTIPIVWISSLKRGTFNVEKMKFKKKTSLQYIEHAHSSQFGTKARHSSALCNHIPTPYQIIVSSFHWFHACRIFRIPQLPDTCTTCTSMPDDFLYIPSSFHCQCACLVFSRLAPSNCSFHISSCLLNCFILY